MVLFISLWQLLSTSIHFFTPQKNDKTIPSCMVKKKGGGASAKVRHFYRQRLIFRQDFPFVFNTQTNFFFQKCIMDEEEMKAYTKISNLFPVCCRFVSRKTPCLLTWQHVMLCQVLSPKKTRWTERSEKHAHKGMWTAFSLWLCFNQSQMQLQSENTSDLFKQQCTLALSKTCRICGVEGID